MDKTEWFDWFNLPTNADIKAFKSKIDYLKELRNTQAGEKNLSLFCTCFLLILKKYCYNQKGKKWWENPLCDGDFVTYLIGNLCASRLNYVHYNGLIFKDIFLHDLITIASTKSSSMDDLFNGLQ